MDMGLGGWDCPSGRRGPGKGLPGPPRPQAQTLASELLLGSEASELRRALASSRSSATTKNDFKGTHLQMANI